jgi:predicted MPP superfamily phosphohydrolase
MNILHLSDIHFGRNYKCYGLKDEFDKKEVILSDLIECIKNVDKEFKVEHIVVTGDIAWYGKRKEFEEAMGWFKLLLNATGLSGKDITFCVGNHDVNRNYSSIDIKYNNSTIKEIDDAYDYSQVHKYEASIYDYNWFCENIGVEPFIYPRGNNIEYSYSLGYKDIKFPSGSIIRLIAFNTALLSYLPNISEDKMWIGQNQIRDLIKYGIIPINEDIHYSIALLHHAERFLHPNEICEYDGRTATMTLLKDNVDLILCGHTETGGKPVLQKQLGGGMVLTAGATYYSDTHPNAFSMLHVPDNKKDLCFQPFIYDKLWKAYEYQTMYKRDSEIKKLPPLGEIREACKLVIKANMDIYEIPIKSATVYLYEKDGISFCRITNEKEVLRKLDIECIGAVLGGNAKFNVKLNPKMERNVEAMLEREKFFSFLECNLNKHYKTEFSIESLTGTKILTGDSINCSIEETDTDGITILECLVKIEKFYDIKFWRPDDIYELDNNKIRLMLELIENGYTEQFKIDKKVMVGFDGISKMKEFYSIMQCHNSVYLRYESEFYCSLFGVKFFLGKCIILAGEYEVELNDLKEKIETYKEGDLRKINLIAKNDSNTFFITDFEKAKEAVKIHNNSEILMLPSMQLNFGFIYEK